MMKKNNTIVLLVAVITSCSTSNQEEYKEWRNYAGTKDAMRYSALEQINTDNVKLLEVAWTFGLNDKDPNNRSQNQCNPIIVDGVLYGTSPRLKLFAIAAATGETKWVFDPALLDTARQDAFAYFKVNRGVVYWQDDQGKEKRIIYNVSSKTYSIDIRTGKPDTSFGKGGYIDLTENLDREPGTYNPFVVSTTPGVIYKDVLVMGHRVAETADAAPGHIRAYDIHTGKLKWLFHTIPHPGEKGYETWEDKDAWKKFGGANSWAGMSVDEKRGIVYVPTGSIGGDFYGGIRKGANLFGNSLLALDALTGKLIWHFQFVHHDIWDRDLPATPNLLTIHKDGKAIDVVAQITKQGYVFMFNRENGEPIYPIEEKSFPASDLPGEAAWPTQPIPSLPEPFARQLFKEEEVSALDSATHRFLLEKYRKVKFNALFTPPSKESIWIFPGYDGGGEWGGASVDPETEIMYVNGSEMPWIMTMIDVPGKGANSHSMKGIGQGLYGKYCVACHGVDLKGVGSSFPSLIGLNKKYKMEQAWNIIYNGKNMMPAFRQISGNEKDALLAFVMDTEDKEPGAQVQQVEKKSILDEVPYTTTGYNRFLDQNNYPGIKPPWGNLNAINLSTGKIVWKSVLGEFPELTAKGIPPTGTENYGGSVVTKGGLVFIAATKDEKIRAFDKKTGKILWEHGLPAAGYATPAVYMADGREFVVIACGGGKIGSKSGDTYVAFSLPKAQ